MEDNMTEEQKVNSRVDFSLPEKLDCHAHSVPLAMTKVDHTPLVKGGKRRGDCLLNENPTTADATLTPHPAPLPQGAREKRCAFTLAEVLITLGIIGVVAAMTLPALIQNHRKHVVEVRLKKFYTEINQAVKMAEVQYGDKKDWFEDLRGAQLDDNGEPIPGTSEQEKWFNKYLAPYLVITKTKILPDGSFMVYFPNGSALKALKHTTRDWHFIPTKPDKCKAFGICKFTFNFNPSNNTEYWKYHKDKGFEPFKYSWGGTLEQLENACYKNQCLYTSSSAECGKFYCTALIQYNGWKIPDDYPYKF